MFIIKLFYGLILIGIGGGIIKYRKQVKSWTGNWVWAERYIGRGGTYFIMLLLGLFLIFLGVLYPFGVLDKYKNSTTDSNTITEDILSD